MLNFAICDDNVTVIRHLKDLVLRWASSRNVETNIKSFPSAEAFLFDYTEDARLDILLLDIEMKNMNGIELAKKIRLDNEQIQIIFVTGYPDFIAEGYDVSALHYLIKPVQETKLFEVLDRANQKLIKSKRTVLLSCGKAQRKISAEAIIYAEAFSHSVSVTTREAVLEIKMQMEKLERLLGEGFIRCHRSYLVGIGHIVSITKTELLLDTGKVIPISRSAAPRVCSTFVNYCKEQSL